MTSNIRYELSKTLAEYFIYHLQVELTKPAKVTDYMTIEGPSFMDYTKKMIHDLEKEFPDRKRASPRFNFFKHWWEKSFRLSANIDVPYEETTFKTQNQIFYFKILDIKNHNEEARINFRRGMESIMKIFRQRGRNVSFEIIFSSEVRMLPILEKIIYIERLPFFKSKDLLYEQNIFIQRTAYQIIDEELKASYKRTDDILKAILPEQIIEELKKTGKVKPVLHDSVSILFCDLTGFTKISSELSPENLLIELDQSF